MYTVTDIRQQNVSKNLHRHFHQSQLQNLKPVPTFSESNVMYITLTEKFYFKMIYLKSDTTELSREILEVMLLLVTQKKDF